MNNDEQTGLTGLYTIPCLYTCVASRIIIDRAGKPVFYNQLDIILQIWTKLFYVRSKGRVKLSKLYTSFRIFSPINANRVG